VTTKTLTVKLVSALTDAGRYYCEVTKYGQTVSGGNRVLSIVQTAQNTTVLVGSPLALSQPVALGQNDLTLTYLWKKGTSSLVPNQNSQILSLGSCSLGDSGSYSCAVSLDATTPLAFGSRTVTAPTVVNVSVVENVPLVFNTKVSSASTKLSVNTSGPGLTYLWKRSGGSLTGTKYSGLTTNTLTISNITAADLLIDYVCTVNGYSEFKTDVSVQLKELKPSFGTIDPPKGIVGSAYNYQIPVSPDVNASPDSYASTALPAGLTLNSKTGVISGVPSAPGTKSLTFTITNESGSATATATIDILPFPTAIAGAYNGPIARGSALTGELGGTFSMTITTTGAISGSIVSGSSAARAFTSSNATLSLPINPSTGALTSDPKVVISLPATSALPSLAIELFLSRTAVSGSSVQSTIITDGTIVAGSSTPVSFTGWRNKWSATAAPNTSEIATAYAGLYNVGMDLSLPSALSGQPAKVPQGSGYLTFTVSANGGYTVTGIASDGEAITTAAFIGPNGQLLIFDTMYSTTQKGSFLSSNLDATTPTNNLSIVRGVTNNVNRIQGQLTWNRPATTARLYKNGFGFGPNTPASTPDIPEPVMLTSFGGRYNPPLAATVANPTPLVLLGISAVTAPTRNADLVFSENGVLPIITASRNPNIGVSILKGNTLTIPTKATTANPASTAVTISSLTGLFSGQFTLTDQNPRGTPATISRTVQYKALLVPVTVSGQDPVYSSVGVGAFTIDLLPASGTTQTATTTPQQVGRVVLQKR
jgi:hypothetical protein